MPKPNASEIKRNNADKHKEFIRHYYGCSANPTKYARISRAKSIIHNNDGTTEVEFSDFKVLNRVVTLYPEALPYLFTLEGCAKKLFLYLLFIHLDKQTGQVKFNISIIDEFKNFCNLFGDTYTDNSIKQAVKELRDKNIMYNLRKGLNRVNPLITAKNEAARASLLKDYSFHIVNDGLDNETNFLPRYS